MVVPELRKLEVQSPEMPVETERKSGCMYEGSEHQTGRPHCWKGQSGWERSVQESVWGRGPARREEEEGGQQGHGSVQREVGDGRCGSVGGG